MQRDDIQEIRARIRAVNGDPIDRRGPVAHLCDPTKDKNLSPQFPMQHPQMQLVAHNDRDAASRTLFDSSPVALLLSIPFSRITSANDKMLELSGYPRTELLGRTFDELGLLVDDALGLHVLAKLGHDEVVDGLETNLRRRDGAMRRVLLSSRLIDVGGVRQHLHSLADITAQKAAMDESRLVRQAMAAISQGVLISGPDRLTLSINAAFASMTGYTEQETVGRSCSILQGVDTDPQVVEAIRHALDAGQAFTGEILNYRKDGTTFWNELSINPVRDDDGRLTHFVGIQRNVSERRRQEGQIRLAAQIFAQSREGVTVTDAHNKIVMVNHAFTDISGYSESEVLGKDPRVMDINAIDEEDYRAKWQTIRDTGRWQGDTVARRKDGTPYPESLTINVIRDENGDVCNYVRTFSDLSQQRAANERIERLSHFDALTDLPNRNLLADRCEHDIKAARRDATPMTMLLVGIDQFKTINNTLGHTVGDQLLRQFAAWLSMSVREMSAVQFRNPALAQQVAAALTEFDMDPASLCLELTEGAVMDDVAHSETLMRELKALGVGLSLDDFGTGYSSLSYLKLFPFDKVKIDQSFVRGIQPNSQDAVIAKVVISMAHGLGLRAIAEGVETELQCEFLRSNMCDEIQGYFFSRPLPAVAIASLLQEGLCLPGHLVRLQPRSRTMLLVDDEPHVASALKRLLRSEGYRILTANSGPEGLKILASNPVDIIVADQRMPGMTGVEFLRQAKLSHPQTIRIVLSGHTELQSVTDAINEGAVYRFLTKPWDDSQLCSFIQDAFRHKDLADENEQLNFKIRTANHELATSNRQLQDVLDHKQHELSRGARSLVVMQEALHNIPLPILAIDDGMIAFANRRAQETLGQGRPLLLGHIDAVLPSLGAALAAAREGQVIDIDIGERTYRCQWHTLGKTSSSKGKLLVFDSASEPPAATRTSIAQPRPCDLHNTLPGLQAFRSMSTQMTVAS